MLEWFNNLDPAVQAAIITGGCTVGGALIGFIGLWIKRKGDNKQNVSKNIKQENSGNNGVHIGEQKQNGKSNVLNNYYNCNIQNPSFDETHEKFVKEQIEKYMEEHDSTDDDIAELFVGESTKKSTDKYLSEQKKGAFTFDYSNNNGEYTIGFGDFSFVTKWSKASDNSIHAYTDSLGVNGGIARVKKPDTWPSAITDEMDFSSRVRTPNIGDIIIWRNSQDKYAATKIISIKDDTRGAENDELTCEYIIYGDVKQSNTVKMERFNSTGGKTVIIDDAKHIAERVVEERNKEMMKINKKLDSFPKIHISTDESKELKSGDIWLQLE